AITLDDDPEFGEQTVEFELPLQVASVSQRIYAVLIDGVLVALSLGVFALVALKFAGSALEPRLAAATAAIAMATFWCLYHIIFLTWGGLTPGMRLAALDLCDFEGQPLTRAARRGRAIAMMVSAAPLALGF